MLRLATLLALLSDSKRGTCTDVANPGRELSARVYDGRQVSGGNQTVDSCVERVLRSKTFRNAPSSRRLLKYLSDHSQAGDADQLKEYIIGIDAFGKSSDYDPRVDSTVRIQIGRLRQKLAEYYLEEGSADPLVVDLPKGGFSLICEPRTVVPPAEAPVVEPVEFEPVQNPWRTAAIALAALLVVSLAAGAILYLKRPPAPLARSSAAAWSPELAELWAPFVSSGRALIIAVGNPLFLEFQNKVLYRDLSIEKPEDLLQSSRVSAMRQAMGGIESRPVYYYAAVGDVTAAFQLGQRLGPQQANISVIRSTQLQWQQMADANVLFLGPPRFFGDKLRSLPASLEIIETTDGFQVLYPQPGEPSLYKFRDPPGFLAEDGEANVLVTHTAGPVGNTDVITFASNSTFGRAGAVAAFTDPAFAHLLVGKMRGSSGHISRYFQVLLEVRYKGGVPTETTFLLYRELRRRS
jgi:hypothetical protein